MSTSCHHTNGAARCQHRAFLYKNIMYTRATTWISCQDVSRSPCRTGLSMPLCAGFPFQCFLLCNNSCLVMSCLVTACLLGYILHRFVLTAQLHSGDLIVLNRSKLILWVYLNTCTHIHKCSSSYIRLPKLHTAATANKVVSLANISCAVSEIRIVGQWTNLSNIQLLVSAPYVSPLSVNRSWVLTRFIHVFNPSVVMAWLLIINLRV